MLCSLNMKLRAYLESPLEMLLRADHLYYTPFIFVLVIYAYTCYTHNIHPQKFTPISGQFWIINDWKFSVSRLITSRTTDMRNEEYSYGDRFIQHIHPRWVIQLHAQAAISKSPSACLLIGRDSWLLTSHDRVFFRTSIQLIKYPLRWNVEKY